jgi:hypothetical protein
MGSGTSTPTTVASTTHTRARAHAYIHTYMQTRTQYTSKWGARKRGSGTETGTWYAHNSLWHDTHTLTDKHT